MDYGLYRGGYIIYFYFFFYCSLSVDIFALFIEWGCRYGYYWVSVAVRTAASRYSTCLSNRANFSLIFARRYLVLDSKPSEQTFPLDHIRC